MLNLFRRKPPELKPRAEAPDWEREGFECAEFYTPPAVTITLTVRQVPPSHIARYCGGRGNACTDRARGIITIPRIKHDYDAAAFAALGHEVWHLLGGRHRGT